jgi:hypothetical protein
MQIWKLRLLVCSLVSHISRETSVRPQSLALALAISSIAKLGTCHLDARQHSSYNRDHDHHVNGWKNSKPSMPHASSQHLLPMVADELLVVAVVLLLRVVVVVTMAWTKDCWWWHHLAGLAILLVVVVVVVILLQHPHTKISPAMVAEQLLLLAAIDVVLVENHHRKQQQRHQLWQLQQHALGPAVVLPQKLESAVMLPQ